MPTRRALVVDDSKTARVTLGRVLNGFDLEVDMADSAESALDYLQHTRPDVIFMDHMMPGMDGFEAVKVIKTDPRTATIPIMMYTTKSGEVYVGQARALGAVGVLPKEVKPADLETVLRGLNIVSQTPPPGPRSIPEKPTSTTESESTLSDAAEQLQRYADDLVTVTQLRQLLDDQHRRLSEEVDAKLEQSLARYADVRRRTERRYLYTGLAILGGMMLLLPYWTVQMYTTTTGTIPEGSAPAVSAEGRVSSVLAGSAASDMQDLRTELQALRSQRSASTARMLETVSWALNHSMEYDYGEIPLDGPRLDTLRDLLTRLNDLGIEGTVNLDVHSGAFCLQRDEFDNLVPAEQGIAVADCDPIALNQDAIPTPEQSQSLEFANFLATSPLVQASAVEVRVNLVGRAEPRIEYPELASSPTAGVWNAAARSNNRVEIRLAPPPG